MQTIYGSQASVSFAGQNYVGSTPYTGPLDFAIILTVLVLAMAFMVVWVKFDNKQSIYIPSPPIMPMLPVPQQSSIMIDIAGGGEGHHR